MTEFESMICYLRNLEQRISLLEAEAKQRRPTLLGAETMSKSAAARILGVTRQTVYEMLRDGRLKADHRGKLLAGSVNALMNMRGRKNDEEIHAGGI